MAEAIKAPKTKKAAVKKAPKADGSFAVIATGGKQYIVRAGDTLKIEKLPGTFSAGDSINFDSVLMIAGAGETKLGSPFIKDASVSATLVKMARNKTIDVIKYKQKSRYFKKYGHRQPYFEVKIDSIN